MGRISALKIRIHPSLILWLSILFYLKGNLVLPFLFAAAFHETGHYLMLRKLRNPPHALTLCFSGAKMETLPMGYRQERLAAASGPIFSFVLTFFFPLIPLTACYSLLLGIINLFPLPGLDGYRILKTTFYQHACPENAESILQYISLIFSFVLVLTAGYLSAYLHLGLWPLAFAFVFLLRVFGKDVD